VLGDGRQGIGAPANARSAAAAESAAERALAGAPIPCLPSPSTILELFLRGLIA